MLAGGEVGVVWVVELTEVVVAVMRVDNEEPVLEAVIGPLQCQWSPWGSQPYDSVGLGARLAVPEESVCAWSWSSSSPSS